MTTCFKIGIDIGGTFTDLVAFDERTGRTLLLKVPSTPHDPSEGAARAIADLLARHPAGITAIAHATTIGTNLFLGQMGLNLPRGALVTTEGFRDVLEIGRQRRPESYNLFFERPRPLIPRSLRLPVAERTTARGVVLKSPGDEEIRALARHLRREQVETVAIVFLHAYANPENERKVREVLTQELPEAAIVASHEVDPTYREYERTSTTVVNSLLVPVVSRYVEKLARRLTEQGIRAPLHIMQSSGGLATANIAVRIPAAVIESGPATGVTAAAEWGRWVKRENLLSFDMGGTTAKAGMVIGGVPQMVPEYEVGGKVHGGRLVKGSGYPVRYPFVDLAEVSGGGGTIAGLDEDGALKVGPLSAGADPGPVCYGKGGREPTVTDADVVLGRLGPRSLAGGTVPLRPESAAEAIAEHIARPLGMSIPEAACGILEIVHSHMMRAVRLVSIERGHDPRRFAMVAFGGAGPMHAAFLAEAMGIPEVFIPPHPGVFSALGLLLADFRHDLARSVLKTAESLTLDDLAALFSAMETEGTTFMKAEGFPAERIRTERHLAMRYVGQSYELDIPLQRSLAQTVRLFHRRHREVYGYAGPDEPVKVVSAHLTLRGLAAKPCFEASPIRAPAAGAEGALMQRRPVFFAPEGWRPTPVYERDRLLPGAWIEGPAVIEEYDATTVVPPGWHAAVDELANLCLKRGT